jgi:hypothetical protein
VQLVVVGMKTAELVVLADKRREAVEGMQEGMGYS